jgi:hypothetical protein
MSVVLIVLLAAASAAVWFVMRDTAPPPANAAFDNDAAALNGEPLDAQGRQRPDRSETDKPRRDPRPTRTQDDRANESDEAEDESSYWVLRGRIEFKDSRFRLESVLDLEEMGVYAAYMGKLDNESDFAFYRVLRFGDNWSFDERIEAEFLPQNPDGPWHIMPHSAGARGIHDLDEGEDPSGLPGWVTPTITGRVIDFGTVVFTSEAVHDDDWFVTGRVIHSSGRPVALASALWLVTIESGEVAREYVVSTDESGAFITTMGSAELSELESLEFLLSSGEQYGVAFVPGGVKRGDSVMLSAPTITGRVVDFGEITVGGALIEVEARMDGVNPVLRGDGSLNVSAWGNYEGVKGGLGLTNGAGWLEANLYPSPFKSTVWTTEGRFRWNAVVYDRPPWQALSGVIDAFDGKVTPLLLEFKRFSTIVLHVETADGSEPEEDVEITWSIRENSRWLGDGNFRGLGQHDLPVMKGQDTLVQVSVPGYYDVNAVATSETSELTVKLEPTGEKPVTWRVVLPELPDGIGGTLVVVDPGGFAHSAQQLTYPETAMRLYFSGECRVELRGGGMRGYPGNLLSGPVNVTVAGGDDVRVVLPAIEPPPWDVAATGVKNQITCGGMNVKTSGGWLGEAGYVYSYEWQTGNTITPSAPINALSDGDEIIALELKPPDKPGAAAILSGDLEARVEVSVWRRGQPIDFYAIGGSRQMMCESVDGIARLWLPPGTASVSVYFEGAALSKSVTVQRGQTRQVRFECEHVRLELVVPEDNNREKLREFYELPPAWRITALDDDAPRIHNDIYEDTVLMLNPGRYRLVSCYGEPIHTIDLDLSDGADRRVELPELRGFAFAELRLKFSHEQFSDLNSFDAGSITLTAAQSLDDWYFDWINVRLVPDGLVLAGLPVGVDLIVSCQTWQEEHVLMIPPLKIKLPTDGMSVDIEWVRTVEIGDHWHFGDLRCTSLIPGALLPIEMLRLPGRHEVTLFHQGKPMHTCWIDVPAEVGEGGVSMPADLRALMVELELMSADD